VRRTYRASTAPGVPENLTRRLGEPWTPQAVRQELANGADEIGVRIEECGEEFAVTHDLAPKERDILLSGGLLHYLKGQAAA
jgi:hypothetical protein